MKTSLLLLAAGLTALVPLATQAKIVRTVEKTFNVQPGGHLIVQTQGGAIRVETSNDPVVKVVAREQIRASTEAEADELLQKLALAIEQDNAGVKATALYDEGSSSGFHIGSWPPVQVDFTVTAPANYNVELKTSGGDVMVGNLAGTVNVRTSGGDIALGKISGDIRATTSGGSVRLEEGQGVVKLRTSGGDIRVGRAAGPTDVETSGGSIEVKSVGNILEASTSGGNVSAGIVGPLKGACKLETSGGRVRVTIDSTAAFDLNASTSGGDVEAKGLTIAIEKGGAGRSRLAGKVNGGGPELKLRSSGGNIVIQTR